MSTVDDVSTRVIVQTVEFDRFSVPTASSVRVGGRPGLGTRFRVAGMRAAGGGCDAVPVRCLIVDDSPGFLAAAARLLQRQGIIIAGVASNGAEALRQVEQLRPDLALVDIDLGGESGLELVGRLPVPAILISTHDEQDYRDLIAASPAVGFLPKTALSASAIHEMLGSAATGPRET